MVNEVQRRTLRILMDLQACQTSGSGTRGVGRYSKALFTHIGMERGQRDLFALVSPHLPIAFESTILSESRVLRLPELPNWSSPRDYKGGEEDTLDGLALSAFLAPIKSDIISSQINPDLIVPSSTVCVARRVVAHALNKNESSNQSLGCTSS